MENNEFENIYDQKEDLSDVENTVFRVAKAEYKSLVEYLSNKVLPARVEFENKFENTEFSLEQGIKDLDIILQYSLVEIGYKSGAIKDGPLETIEGVCEKGSLMNEIRVKNPYFNWTDFTLDDSNEESGKILKSLAVFMNDVSRDFAHFFVFVNPSIEDIYFAKEVQQKMNNIINVIYDNDITVLGSEKRYACITNAIFKQLIR